jgi:hypothetical protein
LETKDFLEVTDSAIRSVYRNDIQLIELKVNERAVAHRLAVYLERLISGWDVDCEYNRYGKSLDPKKLPGIEECKKDKPTDWIIPDILIHVRHSEDRDNFAVFEIKLGQALDQCDKMKLIGMTAKDGDFKYDFGIGVEFYFKFYVRHLFINGVLQKAFSERFEVNIES